MKVNLWNLETSIFNKLRSLPKQRYLCAMWVLSRELQLLYGDRYTGNQQQPIDTTLILLRRAIDGEFGQALESDAGELAEVWQRRLGAEEDSLPFGLGCAWMVFMKLSSELAGRVPMYEATNWVTTAAKDAWRQPNPLGFEVIDKNEEVDYDSPECKTLRRFERVVDGAGTGEHCDPEQLLVLLDSVPDTSEG